MSMEDDIMDFGTALLEGCMYVLGQPYRQSTISGSAALFILRDDPEGLAQVITHILDTISADRPPYAPPCPEVKVMAGMDDEGDEGGILLISVPAGTNGDPILN